MTMTYVNNPGVDHLDGDHPDGNHPDDVVVTFYKFVALPDYADWQVPLRDLCQGQGVKGTILLAAEGINATIAGPRWGIDRVLNQLRSDQRFADLTIKEATAAQATFDRLKVKLKREIVTFGQPQVDPQRQVGTYVAPADWNALISDPDVMVIDTRNDFEVRIGTFAGAVNPQTQSFGEFPDYVTQHCDPARQRKVAMFCTGGIRCEKASSYMLSQGFEQVYHLDGGILKYLETVPPEESLWQGECFVFDRRVALTHGLVPGRCTICPSCRQPLSPADQQSAHYEEGIACPYCFEQLTDDQRQRFAERKRQRDLQRQRQHDR
jgi:UPF0176 protein